MPYRYYPDAASGKNIIAPMATIPHWYLMRFANAYRAALRHSGVSISSAASIAGMPQSSLSRFLSGDRPIYADHVAALIRALPNDSDREHCVLAFLRDQCPLELESRLTAHFGRAEEAARFGPTGDDLDDAVAAIRRAAADGNTAARRVVLNLARAVDPHPPNSKQRPEGGGPADTFPGVRAG